MIYALNEEALKGAGDAETANLSSFGLTLGGQILQRVELDPNNSSL